MGNKDRRKEHDKKPKKGQKPKVSPAVAQVPVVVEVVKRPKRGRDQENDGG